MAGKAIGFHVRKTDASGNALVGARSKTQITEIEGYSSCCKGFSGLRTGVNLSYTLCVVDSQKKLIQIGHVSPEEYRSQ